MQAKPIVLMYHRVVNLTADPWQLAVAPDRFEEQLSVIRHSREPFSMTEFVERLGRGDLPPNAVSVTFDDGYTDNLLNAKPRLAEAQIPATFYVTTASVGCRREFWWDELARLILDTADIDCKITIGGTGIQLKTDHCEVLPTWQDWRNPRTRRERLYLEVWGLLRNLQTAEREELMTQLRFLSSSIPSPRPEDLPMTEDEIRELIRDGLIDLGAHSVSHLILPTLSTENRWREIVESKTCCERLVGKPVQGFSYPYGQCDESTRRMVSEAGFVYACTTASPNVSHSLDRFQLPRLQVKNWSGEQFERVLCNCGRLGQT